MSKNFLFLVAIFILIVGVASWKYLWKDGEKKHLTADPPIHSRQKQEKIKKSEIKFVEKPKGLNDEEWVKFQQRHAIRMISNKRVDFYGKVVDQNGNPIDGVELKIRIVGYEDSLSKIIEGSGDQFREEFTIRTDEFGLFSVEEKRGTSFLIKEMAKEGYTRPDWGVNFHYFYSNISAGPSSSKYHQPDSENPVVYEMWKTGKTEPLILQDATLRVEPAKGINAAYYAFELKGEPSAEPFEGWDMKLTGINRRSRENPNSKDDYWEVTLTANEGRGFAIANGSFANLAPQSGYQQTLTLKSTDMDHPIVMPKKRIYFQGEGGEKYAVFRLELRIGNLNTNGRIIVMMEDLRINPNRSRNLELDESKEIK